MMKKSKVVKTVGTVAVVAGSAVALTKMAKGKIDNAKEQSRKEEEAAREEGRIKYNVVASDREIILNEPEIEGFEIKATMSNVLINMSEQVITEDIYVGFDVHVSNVWIITPENVNVVTDIKGSMSSVKNNVSVITEEGTKTIYIMGTAACSNVVVKRDE